jgi:hypothetical protein
MLPKVTVIVPDDGRLNESVKLWVPSRNPTPSYNTSVAAAEFAPIEPQARAPSASKTLRIVIDIPFED